MSDDGADLGITADRALETVLGGKDQPEEDEKKSPEQMRAWLMSLPKLADIEIRIEPSDQPDWPGDVEKLYVRGTELKLGYGEASGVAARAVLDFLEEHPEHGDVPMENVYAEDADWRSPTVLQDSLKQRGLYDVMKDEGWNLSPLGLTGFMWGWAFNAVCYCREEPPQPNPAILTVGSE